MRKLFWFIVFLFPLLVFAQTIIVFDEETGLEIPFVEVSFESNILGYTDENGEFTLNNIDDGTFVFNHSDYESTSINWKNIDVEVTLSPIDVELGEAIITPLKKRGKLKSEGKRERNSWFSFDSGIEVTSLMNFSQNVIKLDEFKIRTRFNDIDSLNIELTFYEYTENGPGEEYYSQVNTFHITRDNNSELLFSFDSPINLKGPNAYVGIKYADNIGFMDNKKDELNIMYNIKKTKRIMWIRFISLSKSGVISYSNWTRKNGKFNIRLELDWTAKIRY